jgi:hypothetical protein
MKLSTAIEQALAEPNRTERARRVSRIIAQCRLLLGLTYEETRCVFEPFGITPDQFEELMVECDEASAI